ncbi:MAG: hypothetical protein U1D55_10085 [Phycisphaerae bacterium]
MLGLSSTRGCIAAIAIVAIPLAGANAQTHAGAPVAVSEITRLIVSPSGVVTPELRGPCRTTSTHTDATFQPAPYIAEHGFTQGESFVAEYTISSAAYPIKIESMETIFVATDTLSQTVTEWSVLVWDGPPTGLPVIGYSSDGTLLPHVTIPATGPGTTLGVNLVVQIDPSDPQQIILINAAGTNTFSIGFRVDRLNDPPAFLCDTSPNVSTNAFPVVDTSGVASLSGNWLDSLNCGGLCDGINRFQNLLPFFCRPSGDWVLRSTWSSVNCQPPSGACCAGGTCTIQTQTECQAAGGVYHGDNMPCSPNPCPQPTVACCFQATSGCLNLTVANCQAAGGIPGPNGSSCGTTVCFPHGACCLPDGTCVNNLLDTDCVAQGGVFQGNNTNCGSINCPPPTGACCFSTGFCLPLTQADCVGAGATWHGMGTDCSDNNGNGTADVCEQPCVGDVNGDHRTNESDLGLLLQAWHVSAGGDLDHDGDTDESDLGLLLQGWGCGG